MRCNSKLANNYCQERDVYTGTSKCDKWSTETMVIFTKSEGA